MDLAAQALPPRRDPSRPRARVPAGACDTHAHVFAPAGVYPYAARRPYTPASDTGLAAYRRMLAAIGFGRAVLVHSNIYGPDNRATTDALAEMPGPFAASRWSARRSTTARSRRSPPPACAASVSTSSSRASSTSPTPRASRRASRRSAGTCSC
jgi:hypothetical protein